MARYSKGSGLCGPTVCITTPKRITPGPKYALPTLTGYDGHDTEASKARAPAYSMRIRIKDGIKFKSPGPAAYLPKAKQTRTGNDGTAAYSLAVRHHEVQKNINPGPGAYAPEKHAYPPSRTAPEYTIGKRLRVRMDDSINRPGPNIYNLPSRIGTGHPDLRKAPAYFLTFRDKNGRFDCDYARTPGPAAYPPQNQNTYKLAPPMFTMRPKTALPGDKTQKPGPGTHKPEGCPHTAYSLKRNAPAFSFGVRHHEYAVGPVFTDCEIVCAPQPCIE